MTDCYIYNFKTTAWEFGTDLTTLPVECLKDYMVQDPALHGLFEVFQAQGMEPLDAYQKCLETYVEIAERRSST